MGLRYQAAYMFGEKTNKFRPFIGASFELFIAGREINPYVSNEYAYTHLEVGGKFGVVAGMRVTVLKQFFIDLDLAAGVLGVGVYHNSTANPNVPIRQQTTNSLFLDGPINQIRASAAVGMYLRYHRGETAN